MLNTPVFVNADLNSKYLRKQESYASDSSTQADRPGAETWLQSIRSLSSDQKSSVLGC